LFLGAGYKLSYLLTYLQLNNVVLFRLNASESLINGYITAIPCEEYGLPLPGICDCEGETDGCVGPKRFRMAQAALLDASAALSCYANISRLVSQPLCFYYKVETKNKYLSMKAVQYHVACSFSITTCTYRSQNHRSVLAGYHKMHA